MIIPNNRIKYQPLFEIFELLYTAFSFFCLKPLFQKCIMGLVNQMEKELWQYLKTAQKPIVLYGMGNGADKIINVLEQKGIPFKGVFASDGFVRDKTFHGFKISSYNDLLEKFSDMIVLLCFGSERPEVLENIKRIALEQELYAPEVPVIGGGLFDGEYYATHEKEFEEIYGLLADERSKKTFSDIINYKLSGKIDYLFDCEVSKDEPYESFLSLSENETFMDLGAYTGDTVSFFLERVSGYNKIIAVEPDQKSFRKLKANTENISRIRTENVAVSRDCGIMPFSMKGGRNSSAFRGESFVEFKNIDSLCEDECITYIKMDLEGEEENAILGGKNTILKYKPKMSVSAYHRTDDFLRLPKAVFNIRSDYKLYLRHFKSLPAWDTNFYFI